MNDLHKLVVALCCTGALAVNSACSTTTSAQANDSTTRPAVTEPADTTPAPDTATPDTTAPVTTVAETVPDTAPETTEPAPTTTVVSNVELVGPWPVAIVAVGKESGPDTAAAQLRLTQLGFWAGDGDGEYGFATTQAVMAFQKYMGLDPSGKIDQDTANWLTVFPERAHGQADDGTLVEVDKTKQLLFLIEDGKTIWAFNTSTGSGIAYTAHNQNTGEIETGDAVTPNGLWKTNRERPNGWWSGDLGDIYRPKYFRGGVAIHGMTRVPNTPVSHGCVRLSTMAMDFLWDNDLVPLGTPVWVHE
ncbi:MAG: L,D-transpeptidase family protein [Actinomycetia bacterium]|nr:L,D-transpeptidase family protein [Actinomycetes bacterium]